jgi:CHASE3 domain sensor protein
LIENDIASLESGHRGFLLSGSEDYIAPFEKKRDLIKHRIEDLTALILDSPRQRKRVMKVQEVVQKWLETLATPEINSRRSKGSAPTAAETNAAGSFALGNSLLDQARELLQSLQDEEQIVLNERMHDQEWATQSAQILDFLPKLERSVVEMEKEKRGYLLTGENSFAEADKRAVADFYTYNGYLSILVANSPTQAQLLAEIRASVERWIGLLIISNSYGFILVRRQLAKLEGAETHIRSVIENILDGMITVDDGGVIRSMNPAAKKCSAVATAK